MPNQLTPFQIEMWSAAALERLDKIQVIGQLVSRDFEEQFVNNKGETIHAHRLGSFTGRRLPNGQAMTTQDLQSTGVDIKLNQSIYVAFEVTERDLNSTFDNILAKYIGPAIVGVSESIDSIVMGEAWNFLNNQVGSTAAAADYNSLVDLNKEFTQRKVPFDNRWLVSTAGTHADLLKSNKLTEAQTSGDGTPIISGFVNQGSGFNIAVSQITPYIQNTLSTGSAAINNPGGYAKGATVLTIDGASDPTGPAVGTYITIGGHVHRVTNSTVALNAGDITITPGLFAAVADNASLFYTYGALINNASGYAVGYDDWITVDGTNFPQIGQGVTIGGVSYGVLDTGVNTILLNRPLETTVSDNDVVGLIPSGNYNLALRPNAIALAVKALPAPDPGAGVLASTISFNGYQLRTMLGFDQRTMKWTYSVDCLVGVKTIDTNQGSLYLGA